MSRFPKTFSFAALTLALATACQPAAGPATPPATPLATPAPAATPPVPPPVAEERLRGQFVIGKDGYGITLCGEQTQRIVGLGPQASALVGELATAGQREFFVEGFGTAHTDTGRNLARIERAGGETKGCDDEVTPFLFKALGTEPFWAVSVAEGKLTLTRPDAPAVSGEFSGSPMLGDHRQFSTSTSEGPVAIDLVRKTCSDGMSDNRYAWTATLRYDGKDFQGCAYAGE